MVKTIEFAIDWKSEYISDMEYQVIMSYEDSECDIYRVETDDESKIRVIFPNDVEHMPYRLSMFSDGIYYVSCWKEAIK